MDANSTRWALMKSNSEIAPNCPRCASSNTKFCYYNNYSLSQPRYFCKGCRRYWTKGGSLRNVPVGGGCRKSRRGRSARPLTSSAEPLHMSKSHGNNGPLMSQDNNMTLNGNDIDMAAVFAKFLNPNWETGSKDHDRSKADDLFFELTSSLESNNTSDTELFTQEVIQEFITSGDETFEASFGIEDFLSDQVILTSNEEAIWPSYDESLDNDVFCQSMVSQDECPCPSVTFPNSDDYNQMKGLGNVGMVDDHHGWSVGSCFDVTSYI